jgi:hypothetical protein
MLTVGLFLARFLWEVHGPSAGKYAAIVHCRRRDVDGSGA